MPRFILERNISGSELKNVQEIQEFSRQSSELIRRMNGEVQWLESIITEDKLYSIFLADEPDIMMEFASYEGLPISKLRMVTGIIDPSNYKD